jgi:hypothetical protein
LIQLYAEQPGRKLFDYRSGHFNTVFFTHSPPEIGMRILPEGRKKAENPLSASIAQKMDRDQLT